MESRNDILRHVENGVESRTRTRVQKLIAFYKNVKSPILETVYGLIQPNKEERNLKAESSVHKLSYRRSRMLPSAKRQCVFETTQAVCNL